MTLARHHGRAHAGFTLVEALASLVLLAMLAVAVMGAARMAREAASASWGQDRTAAFDTLVLAAERGMTRDVSGIHTRFEPSVLEPGSPDRRDGAARFAWCVIERDGVAIARWEAMPAEARQE